MSGIDTPAARIARLDASILNHGEAVTLQRRIGTGATYAEVTTRAVVKGYQADELVGGIKQTDSMFIMSPTQINAAVAATTWPGAAPAGTWPKIGDFLVIDGVQRKIEAVKPRKVGDVVVRIEGRVLG